MPGCPWMRLTRRPGRKAWPSRNSAMKSPTAARNLRCWWGVSRSQSRESDARVSRVGAHGLDAALESSEEVVGDVVAGRPAGGEVGVRLALLVLPLARPEPGLIGIDPPRRDLSEQDPGAVHGVVRQVIDQLVQLAPGHSPNVRTVRRWIRWPACPLQMAGAQSFSFHANRPRPRRAFHLCER